MTHTLDLAIALIRRQSVTPADAGCQDLIADRLAPLGFVAERLDFNSTANLWLRRGQRRPLLVFLGHTDVVPAGPADAWRCPPFAATVRDGTLYGRGAADMKGGIAAFVTAVERFLARHPGHNGSLAVLLTSDEEGPGTDGIVRVVEVLERRQEKIDWCLVGEPSSGQAVGDTIRVGRRGSLSARLRVNGAQGHVAYPHLAHNPIHAFAPALQALVSEVWDQGNAFFPPTSCQVSNIRAGVGAENIIPGHLEAQFNLRFSSELDEAAIRRRTAAILDRHGLDYELEWRLSGRPFLTADGRLLRATHEAIRQVTGLDALDDTGGGTSDGRFIAPTGAQVVELGLRNATIHKIDEQVAVAELEVLSAIYQQLLANLLC